MKPSKATRQQNQRQVQAQRLAAQALRDRIDQADHRPDREDDSAGRYRPQD
jgi:hypothetical protein